MTASPSQTGPAGKIDTRRFARKLLAWYDRHGRALPWRVGPGERADAYRVWISEIMLQQTTVATVAPYYAEFLRRWPGVHDLAAAPIDDVLHAWQGLGYYARARNLHRCAGVVSRELAGQFPDTEDALRRLPGIGPYTAAAIAAIVFDRPAAVVDGNVERVVVRLLAETTAQARVKPRLRETVAGLTPSRRPGDFAQAMMDLGALVCVPRTPDCRSCPVRSFCRAAETGIAATLPRREEKAARPRRRSVAFFITRPDGAFLLRRRAESGLLGGMMEIPSTPWIEAAEGAGTGWRACAPARARWRHTGKRIGHTFTHFHLEIEIVAGSVTAATARRLADQGGVWCRPGEVGRHALPTVMKKIIRAARDDD